MTRTAPLALALLAAACVERAPGSGGRRATFVRRPAARYLAPPEAPRHPAHAIFGGAIELVGWSLEPEPLERGRPATLTLYWRAQNELEASYQVFVHLDGREGEDRIHGDHPPAGGTLPTEAWRRGDLVRDPVRVAIPPGYRGEALDLWVGWYAGAERLAIANAGEVRHDGENRLLLAAVPVR